MEWLAFLQVRIGGGHGLVSSGYETKTGEHILVLVLVLVLIYELVPRAVKLALTKATNTMAERTFIPSLPLGPGTGN